MPDSAPPSLPRASTGQRGAYARSHVVYLGVSGVLHPSESLYRALYGHPPSDDGHRLYEAVPILEEALSRWPDASIVLTSTLPWSQGLPSVLRRLGPGLWSRVIGYTYEDLTTQLRRGTRQLPLSNNDYWRHTKYELVKLHVEWLNPTAWIAVDDDTGLWSEHDQKVHLVAVNGAKGLLDPVAQDRLATALFGNFGPPSKA